MGLVSSADSWHYLLLVPHTLAVSVLADDLFALPLLLPLLSRSGAEHSTFFHLPCARAILPFLHSAPGCSFLSSYQFQTPLLECVFTSWTSTPTCIFLALSPGSVYLTWLCLCSFSTIIFPTPAACSSVSFPTATVVSVPIHLSHGSVSRSELDAVILLPVCVPSDIEAAA